MRADRLLSILMLLQARGQMTAQALAAELEVSERTIYRDVEALSVAGVPVYCEPGPGGGIGLLDSYRTSLTGLTAGEVRALFAISVPEAAARVGIEAELRAALRKLAAALPAAQRAGDDLHAAVYVDATGWDEADAEAVPHLPALHQAVRARQRVRLRYRRFNDIEVSATVAPLGLVAKAGAWHLVYARAGRLWVQSVAGILAVEATDELFAPPAAFDLAHFWRAWCASDAAQHTRYVATVRVAPATQAILPQRFGAALRARLAAAPRDAQGWVTLELAFDRLETARDLLLALGGGVEVLAPLPLRRSVADYAAQILRVYGEGD